LEESAEFCNCLADATHLWWLVQGTPKAFTLKSFAQVIAEVDLTLSLLLGGHGILVFEDQLAEGGAFSKEFDFRDICKQSGASEAAGDFFLNSFPGASLLPASQH